MLLVGAHDLTLDVPKHRLSIPSVVRLEMTKIAQERARKDAARDGTEPGMAVEGPAATAVRAGRKAAGQDDAAGGAFYLKPGSRLGVLEMYEAGHFEEIRRPDVPIERMPRNVRDLRVAEASMTYKVKVDEQGRIMIPERLAKFATLGKDVTLVGAVDHYELMNRDKYEQMLAAQMFAWEQKYDEMTASATGGAPTNGSGHAG